MTSLERQLWDESPWVPSEGKVIYGTVANYPIAYDCFDRKFVTGYDTYVIGDRDSGALGTVADLLGRYASVAGARIFVIDYAGTDYFSVDRTGGVTVPLSPRPDGGDTASGSSSLDRRGVRHLVNLLGPATEEWTKAVSFRLDDLDGKNRAAAAVDAFETVSAMSQEEPETKYILLVTGFDGLVADADDDIALWRRIDGVLRHRVEHLLSIWLMTDHIPRHDRGSIVYQYFWDLCQTALLFPMSAEDVIRYDGHTTGSPVIGQSIVHSLARRDGVAVPSRFAIVLQGRQSARLVVDAL